MRNSKYFFILILLFSGSCIKRSSVTSEYVKLTVNGRIYEGDWLEVNDYRIEFTLPDTTKAIPFTAYNPYILEVSGDNNKVGFLSPTITYDAGPGHPIKKHVSKGIMLLNIAKMLGMLSFSEYDSSIFDYKTDKIAAFSGLLVFGMESGEPVKVTYPQTMNILVEPYKPKE